MALTRETAWRLGGIAHYCHWRGLCFCRFGIHLAFCMLRLQATGYRLQVIRCSSMEMKAMLLFNSVFFFCLQYLLCLLCVKKIFFLKKKEFVGQQMEFSLGSNQTDSFGPRPFPGQLVVLVTRRGREREYEYMDRVLHKGVYYSRQRGESTSYEENRIN